MVEQEQDWDQEQEQGQSLGSVLIGAWQGAQKGEQALTRSVTCLISFSKDALMQLRNIEKHIYTSSLRVR